MLLCNCTYTLLQYHHVNGLQNNIDYLDEFIKVSINGPHTDEKGWGQYRNVPKITIWIYNVSSNQIKIEDLVLRVSGENRIEIPIEKLFELGGPNYNRKSFDKFIDFPDSCRNLEDVLAYLFLMPKVKKHRVVDVNATIIYSVDGQNEHMVKIDQKYSKGIRKAKFSPFDL